MSPPSAKSTSVIGVPDFGLMLPPIGIRENEVRRSGRRSAAAPGSARGARARRDPTASSMRRIRRKIESDRTRLSTSNHAVRAHLAPEPAAYSSSDPLRGRRTPGGRRRRRRRMIEWRPRNHARSSSPGPDRRHLPVEEGRRARTRRRRPRCRGGGRPRAATAAARDRGSAAAPVERVGEPGRAGRRRRPTPGTRGRARRRARPAGTGRRQLTEAEGVPVEAVDVGERVHEVALHARAARPARRRGADRR